MIRYKVIAKEVRYKKKTYRLGEYLPDGFSEKDKYRLLYPSRVAAEDIGASVDLSTPSVAEQKTIVSNLKAQKAATAAKITTAAKTVKAAPSKAAVSGN